MHPGEARELWHLMETVHAVTYFAPSCRDAHAEAGFNGFWMGYFGCRSAPMGPVGPGVVEAVFGGFSPAMVQGALPDAWDAVDPLAAVELRADAAAHAIRSCIPSAEEHASDLLGVLDRAVESAECTGRALFAANRDVMPFEDPIADLWQMCTTLREHRGGGHLAVLTAEGLGGCEAHVLATAAGGSDPSVLRDNRGWSEAEWQEATTTLRVAGVLEPTADTLTERGSRLLAEIESRTDDLAAPPYVALEEAGRDHLRDGLIPIPSAVLEAEWIPFPNPIGLPEIA